MSPSHPERRLSGTTKRYLLGAGILLVCQLPLLLLRHPAASPEQDDSQPAAQTPLILLTDDSAKRQEQGQDLLAWLAIADPMRLLLPDYEKGFSRFSNPRVDLPEPQFVARAIPVPAQATPVVAPTVPEIHTASLTSLVHRLWNRQSALELAEREIKPLPLRVFWFLADGRLLENPPPFEDGELVAASQGEGEIQDVTVLEISQSSDLAIPRLLVRQSCGKRSLDNLAVEAVRRTWLAPSAELTVRGSGGPDYQLLVDWRMLPAVKETL